MKSIRAVIFGIVWSFIMAALGLELFHFWYFVSIIPAFVLFEIIELFYEGVRYEREHRDEN